MNEEELTFGPIVGVFDFIIGKLATLMLQFRLEARLRDMSQTV